MSRSPITVAAAQGRITPDVRENGQEIRRLMRQASAGGASLVHFPEAFLSGCRKAQIKDWDAVNGDAVGDELRATAGLARELGLWVVAGCVHRPTPEVRLPP